MKQPRSAAALVLATTFVTALCAGSVAFAQSGTQVVILFPAGGNLPEPDPGPPTDKLVLTGGRVISVDTAGCEGGFYPAQEAILVDPGAGRGGRIVSLIVLQAQPLAPGTRLSSFSTETTCTSGGTPYIRYRATIE